MSDPMANVEIEDVLSSIRRLVSEDMKSPGRRPPSDSTGMGSGTGTARATFVRQRTGFPAPDHVADESLSPDAISEQNIQTPPDGGSDAEARDDDAPRSPEKLVLTSAYRVDDETVDPLPSDEDRADADWRATGGTELDPLEDEFEWHAENAAMSKAKPEVGDADVVNDDAVAIDHDASTDPDHHDAVAGVVVSDTDVTHGLLHRHAGEDRDTLEATIAELEAKIVQADDFEADGSEAAARANVLDRGTLEKKFEDAFTIDDYAPARGAVVNRGPAPADDGELDIADDVDISPAPDVEQDAAAEFTAAPAMDDLTEAEIVEDDPAPLDDDNEAQAPEDEHEVDRYHKEMLAAIQAEIDAESVAEILADADGGEDAVSTPASFGRHRRSPDAGTTLSDAAETEPGDDVDSFEQPDEQPHQPQWGADQGPFGGGDAVPAYQLRRPVNADPFGMRRLHLDDGEPGRLSALSFAGAQSPSDVMDEVQPADLANPTGLATDPQDADFLGADDPVERDEHQYASDGTEADDPGLFVGPSDGDVIDEAMLRDLVSEIIRQELQGILGERITRNVRKLVRREIQRALTGKELE